jgi:hypothetical protein
MAAAKVKPQSAATRKSWRDVIKIHPAADLFPPMSREELYALGDDITKNGLTAPIAMWAVGDNETHEEFQLLDGRNRLDAMELVGTDVVEQDDGQTQWRIKEHLGGNSYLTPSPRGGSPVIYLYEFHKGISVPLGGRGKAKGYREPATDPYEYTLSVNIRRRHLTTEQKRELIDKLIQANPTKSDRQIGKMAKADGKTVASVRSKKESRAEIPHVETRTDTKGRKQPGSKKSTPKPKPEPAREPERGPPAADITAEPVDNRRTANTVVNDAPKLDSLAWLGATDTERQRFVSEVGLAALFGAATPQLIAGYRDQLLGLLGAAS